MKSICFDMAEKFMKNYQYKEAFKEYRKLIEEYSLDDISIAEAYNMLGVITIIDKNIEVIDDTGLFYFKQALNYDPNNIGALLNVVLTFGNSFENHLDFLLTEQCINKILSLNVELSDLEKKNLDEKRILINQLKENSI
jgi:hypothetical protein